MRPLYALGNTRGELSILRHRFLFWFRYAKGAQGILPKMRSLVFLIPGRLDTPTGGYVYDRRMIEGLRDLGWSVEVRALDASFPHPTTAAIQHAGDILAATPSGTPVLVDGLACGAMPDLVEREAGRLRIVALVHLPLAADVSLDRQTSARFAASEQRALRAAALVIVTGTATIALLAEYQLAREQIVVVEPGTARAYDSGSGQPRIQPLVGSGSQVSLLSVATLQPGKGHAILIDALAPLGSLGWRLICAGSLTRHPETANRVRAAVERLGFDERISFVGELDDASLCRCYAGADVFVLATLQETYGMAVAEALAHGLPIVATTTGAIPDLVGEDAGLLVGPGDTAALSTALRRVIEDSALRARLADGATRVRSRLPTWQQASARMAEALERLVA